MKREYHPASTWAEMRTAFASGIGLRELARNLGIPPGTVLARAHREGWTRQLHEARAIVAASLDAPAIDVSHAAAASMAERGKRHAERVAGIVEKTLPHIEAMESVAVLDNVDAFDRLDKIGRRTYGLDAEERGGEIRLNVFAAFGTRPAIDVDV